MRDDRVTQGADVRIQGRRPLTDHHDAETGITPARDQVLDCTDGARERPFALGVEDLLRSEERRLIHEHGERRSIFAASLEVVELFTELRHEATLSALAQMP